VKPVTVYEAKTHFSKLLARVEKGEEVVVCRGKQPVARVVPFTRKPRRRPQVGEITSKPVRWTRDCFGPLSEQDAESWGL
jgi:prevent-host-death family protein